MGVNNLPVVVAILENPWFRDPVQMQRQLVKVFHGDRLAFIRHKLFYRCRTGKKLVRVFGQFVCDCIIWEFAHPLMVDGNTMGYRADCDHIANILLQHKPQFIMAFGKQAAIGAATTINYLKSKGEVAGDFKLIAGPHLFDRGADAGEGLDVMVQQYRGLTGDM